MIVNSISRRPFSSLHAYGDNDEEETREAHAQKLASRLSEYIPEAPTGKIIELARYVISELPDTTELRSRQRQFPCTVRRDPVTGSRIFFLKQQPTANGTYRKVATVLCLLPNNALIRAKKVVPCDAYPDTLEHQDYDLRILFNPRLKGARGLPKVYAVLSYPWRNKVLPKPCIIMEHFDGELRELLYGVRERRIPPPSFGEVASIIHQMVEGVFALHAHVDEQGTPDPIGHYDIKSANFLFRIERIGYNGRKFVVVLSDFGLHCHVRRTPDKDDTRQWHIEKRRLYPYSIATAPELLNPENAPIATDDSCLKADIWALGLASIQLMHALQRQLPIHENLPWVACFDSTSKGPSDCSVAKKELLHERDRLLKAVRKEYGQEGAPLVDTIEMMLTPDPTQRPHIAVVKQRIESIVFT